MRLLMMSRYRAVRTSSGSLAILPRSFVDPKSHFRDNHHSISSRPHTAYMGRIFGGTAMKILVVGIALAVAIVFTSQAFAAELPDCPNVKWKHGHYVCDEGNS